MPPLRPIDLKSQPAPYQVRYKVIQKIHAVLKKSSASRLSNCDRKAVELEGEVAKKSSSGQSYRFNASVLLRDLSRPNGRSTKANGKINEASGTLLKTQVLEKLTTVLLPVEKLLENGYFLTTTLEVDSDDDAKGGVHKVCIRCNTKFRKDQIMKPTTCRYHIQKRRYNRNTKVAEYPCCGETTSSSSLLGLGCKTMSHHVFRPETFQEMSQISRFMTTDLIEGESNVLALDCEMAFTSMGYELIRLTIVDFFTSKVLFDEIVQPFGEIVDLNTEFSGVHLIEKNKSLSFEETMTRVLSKNLINRNSILIGHGMENDLNVLRIVHRRIIDTAVLYPHGKFKSSLKNLAFETISRRIQSGEHDSSEDAIATMDVLKFKLGIPINQKTWN